nr:MAG TPA: PVL ORF-50-like family [Caudoviricetes sp.]
MACSCLYARLEHGWSIENALLTPSKKGRSV